MKNIFKILNNNDIEVNNLTINIIFLFHYKSNYRYNSKHPNHQWTIVYHSPKCSRKKNQTISLPATLVHHHPNPLLNNPSSTLTPLTNIVQFKLPHPSLKWWQNIPNTPMHLNQLIPYVLITNKPPILIKILKISPQVLTH